MQLQFNKDLKYGYPEEVWFSLNDMPGEEWRCVVGYEGIYKVSNYGRVYSLYNSRNGSGHNGIRKLYVNKFGYLVIDLCKNGVHKLQKVHRLVGKAFIPYCENKNMINHKDGIKTNNYVSNLEWVTALENLNHAIQVLKRGLRPVYQIDPTNNKKIRSFNSIKDAAKHVNVTSTLLCHVCDKPARTAGGYKWETKEVKNGD